MNGETDPDSYMSAWPAVILGLTMLGIALAVIGLISIVWWLMK